MIMIILGATETSRNTTITGLCHYAKDLASLQRARAEINQAKKRLDLEDMMKIEFRNVNPQEFPYLHLVINECLRVNHPVPTSDEYKIL